MYEESKSKEPERSRKSHASSLNWWNNHFLLSCPKKSKTRSLARCMSAVRLASVVLASVAHSCLVVFVRSGCILYSVKPPCTCCNAECDLGSLENIGSSSHFTNTMLAAAPFHYQRLMKVEKNTKKIFVLILQYQNNCLYLYYKIKHNENSNHITKHKN